MNTITPQGGELNLGKLASDAARKIIQESGCIYDAADIAERDGLAEQLLTPEAYMHRIAETLEGIEQVMREMLSHMRGHENMRR